LQRTHPSTCAQSGINEGPWERTTPHSTPSNPGLARAPGGPVRIGRDSEGGRNQSEPRPNYPCNSHCVRSLATRVPSLRRTGHTTLPARQVRERDRPRPRRHGLGSSPRQFAAARSRPAGSGTPSPGPKQRWLAVFSGFFPAWFVG
jgi:hypothetical protein